MPELAGVRVGLVIAMRAEMPALFPGPRMRAIAAYRVGGAAVGLVLSGMGVRRAHEAATRLCREFQPHYLCSLGVCGGVADELAVGDLLVADGVLYGEGHISLAGPRTSEAVDMARRVGCHVHVGAVQTFDWPVLSRRGVAGMALGVDMESYAVAEVARQHGLAAAVVRAISDVVPERATPRTVAAWLWQVRPGFGTARQTLARFADFYLGAVVPR